MLTEQLHAAAAAARNIATIDEIARLTWRANAEGPYLPMNLDAKAGLPVLRTRLHRLVAFQEMSFTGIPPTSGHAGVQCSNFLEDLEALGGLPEATKLAS
jgi:hypothetical protein